MRFSRRILGTVLIAGLFGSLPASAQESWDAIYIASGKVGHIHTKVTPLKDKGRDLLRVQVDWEMNVNRGADVSKITLSYGTIETTSGQVLRLDTRTNVGQDVIRTSGDVINGKMGLKLEAGGQRTEEDVTWGPEVRGPYAIEQSLAREPMKPGETREVKQYTPSLNVVVRVVLSAKVTEEVDLAGKKHDLLRVDSASALPNGQPLAEMNTTYWVDTSGQVMKSFTDVYGGMVTYRTTREGALLKGAPLDLLAASIIKIPRPIPKPETQTRILYRMAIKGDDLTKLFPNDRRQTVKAGVDAKSVTMEVITAGPDIGEPGPEAVNASFLRANAMINSDDPQVAALKNQALVGVSADPWAKAQAINKWVFTNINDKNYKTAFASAKEVARTLKGDCTEHSVLSAAMCRAAGIPARVVVGLLYADSLKGFGFHMWNEVYVNRRWVAIDAAFDQTSVDATHLKLADASLDGVSPFEPLLSVSQVFGKLTLEPIEIR